MTYLTFTAYNMVVDAVREITGCDEDKGIEVGNKVFDIVTREDALKTTEVKEK